ncbi:MAG: hypothetical protein ABUJ92_00535 [Desulfobacterales bacterium]
MAINPQQPTFGINPVPGGAQPVKAGLPPTMGIMPVPGSGQVAPPITAQPVQNFTQPETKPVAAPTAPLVQLTAIQMMKVKQLEAKGWAPARIVKSMTANKSLSAQQKADINTALVVQPLRAASAEVAAATAAFNAQPTTEAVNALTKATGAMTQAQSVAGSVIKKAGTDLLTTVNSPVPKSSLIGANAPVAQAVQDAQAVSAASNAAGNAAIDLGLIDAAPGSWADYIAPAIQAGIATAFTLGAGALAAGALGVTGVGGAAASSSLSAAASAASGAGLGAGAAIGGASGLAGSLVGGAMAGQSGKDLFKTGATGALTGAVGGALSGVGPAAQASTINPTDAAMTVAGQGGGAAAQQAAMDAALAGASMVDAVAAGNAITQTQATIGGLPNAALATATPALSPIQQATTLPASQVAQPASLQAPQQAVAPVSQTTQPALTIPQLTPEQMAVSTGLPVVGQNAASISGLSPAAQAGMGFDPTAAASMLNPSVAAAQQVISSGVSGLPSNAAFQAATTGTPAQVAALNINAPQAPQPTGTPPQATGAAPAGGVAGLITDALPGALGIVADMIGGQQQSDAISGASGLQSQAAQQARNEQRRQFDAMMANVQPFISTGTEALGAQGSLLGLGGAADQQQAITGLEQSPIFQALARQGEEAILQNASATGGLRGGNVQGALGQFRPQLLNQQIQQRLGNLGGLSQMGQSSAVGAGAAGIQTGQLVGQQLGNIGAAQAGNLLGQANVQGQQTSNIAGALGQLPWGKIGSAIGGLF